MLASQMYKWCLVSTFVAIINKAQLFLLRSDLSFGNGKVMGTLMLSNQHPMSGVYAIFFLRTNDSFEDNSCFSTL
jgi:hypothetical protein